MADDVNRPADDEVEAHGGVLEDVVENTMEAQDDTEPDVEAHGGVLENVVENVMEDVVE